MEFICNRGIKKNLIFLIFHRRYIAGISHVIIININNNLSVPICIIKISSRRWIYDDNYCLTHRF